MPALLVQVAAPPLSSVRVSRVTPLVPLMDRVAPDLTRVDPVPARVPPVQVNFLVTVTVSGPVSVPPLRFRVLMLRFGLTYTLPAETVNVVPGVTLVPRKWTVPLVTLVPLPEPVRL